MKPQRELASGPPRAFCVGTESATMKSRGTVDTLVCSAGGFTHGCRVRTHGSGIDTRMMIIVAPSPDRRQRPCYQSAVRDAWGGSRRSVSHDGENPCFEPYLIRFQARQGADLPISDGERSTSSPGALLGTA